MKYLFSILILLISLESISQTDEFIIRGKFRNIKATAVDLMPVLDGVSQITKTEVFENSDSFMIKGLIAQPHWHIPDIRKYRDNPADRITDTSFQGNLF